MTAPQTTPDAGSAAEWTQAAERGTEATERAQQQVLSLPWGCWVVVDVSNPLARLAVKPCCPPDREPDDETASFGVYLQPSHVGDDGRPLAAMVRLHDRAQGIASGVPFAALSRTDYRDTRDLRGGA